MKSLTALGIVCALNLRAVNVAVYAQTAQRGERVRVRRQIALQYAQMTALRNRLARKPNDAAAQSKYMTLFDDNFVGTGFGDTPELMVEGEEEMIHHVPTFLPVTIRRLDIQNDSASADTTERIRYVFVDRTGRFGVKGRHHVHLREYKRFDVWKSTAQGWKLYRLNDNHASSRWLDGKRMQ